jgi:thiamine pyrophosphate-dependent acetolactate synthase large subunit-like protein
VYLVRGVIVGDNQAYISLPKSQEIKAFSDLPEVDWLAFANSFGMEASYSQDREIFQSQLEEAKQSRQPTLLWVRVPGLLDDEFKQTTSLEYKNWLTALRSRL